METHLDQRLRHIRFISPIIIKEFKDIKLAKVMNKEMYYVLEGHNEHSWAANWTYIEANSKYEETIIQRINVTQEYMKDIRNMHIINHESKKVIPYINDFIDIVIPTLNVVISNIREYTCRIEYAGSETEKFENREVYKTELKDVLEYLANK